MASLDSNETKTETFNNKIDEKQLEENLKKIFKERYDENLEDILILEKDLFLNQIKEGIKLILEEYYSDCFFSDEIFEEYISKYMKEIENKYNNQYSLINKAYTNYERNLKRSNSTKNLLAGFRKHCLHTEEYASHNCIPLKKSGRDNNCHFICVYSQDIDNHIDFVICESCKKVYYSSYILSLCNKCNVEYYTSLLSPEENPEMLLATWKKYHCPQLINEKMKCIKCRELFYLDMKNGLLTCSNQNCKFTTKPSRILWTCIFCKVEFKSEVIPYNPLDILHINKLIEQTILLNHKAHPTKLPCCKLNVFFTDFYHKKECQGKLFENELNDKIIVVCEKCHAINYFERFAWTCPKCGKRFRDKKYNRNSNNKNNNTSNKSNNKIKNKNNSENNNDKKKYKDNFTPKAELSNYKRKRFNSQLEQETNRFKVSENKINIYKDNDNNEENNKEKRINQNDKNKLKINMNKKFRILELEDNNEKKDVDKNEKAKRIKKSQTSFKNTIMNKIRNYNTNRGTFSRSVIENKKEKKSTKEDKNDIKKNAIDLQQKTKNINPKFSWKKRLQTEIKKKNNIPVLYTENVNNLMKGEKELDINKYVNTDINYSNRLDILKEKREKGHLAVSKISKNTYFEKENKKKDYSIEEDNKDKNLAKKQLKEDNLEENKESEEESPNNPIISINKFPDKDINLNIDANERISNILNKCQIPEINIGEYIFDKTLGEGGYAVIFSVYKINDENYKEYAMKKIIARDLDEIEKFVKEFELVYSCVHPNIMKIYGISINMLDSTTFTLYVLMEIAKRDWDRDIKKRLKKKKSYSEKELISILRQLTSALLFMQNKLKITHRDIKPQNVLLFENGIYKIADFGEAKETKINKGLNTLRGTELYMSPALYSGLKNEKHDIAHNPYKSDVFSLGFCFLYAATLKFDLLYQVRNTCNTNQMNQILNQQLKKKYSYTFIDILSHMMEIDEKNRYDFSHLIDAIDIKYDKDGNLKNHKNN